MKGFFFLLTNSILLLGPGDHFDFIFPGIRQKMAAPQTNTKDARAEKRRRRTDRDEGKDRKIIIDPAHAFPYYEKPLLRFFSPFFSLFVAPCASKNRSVSPEKPKRITLTASQCSLHNWPTGCLLSQPVSATLSPFRRQKRIGKRNQKVEKRKETCSKKKEEEDSLMMGFPPSCPLLLGSCICHYFGSFDTNASVIQRMVPTLTISILLFQGTDIQLNNSQARPQASQTAGLLPSLIIS
jgi:hypothetical protein